MPLNCTLKNGKKQKNFFKSFIKKKTQAYSCVNVKHQQFSLEEFP